MAKEAFIQKRTPHPLFQPLRDIVAQAIRAPQNYEWTVQGLGMLRCYPFSDTTYRLNIWHDSFRLVPPASDMHDHPWHLTSYVIGGVLYNQRYIPVERGMPGDYFEFREIVCGPEACNDTTKIDAHIRQVQKLGRRPLETYVRGDVYKQRAEEIHSTTFLNGTVTLNYRVRVNGDAARVFYPMHTQWIDAKPRRATWHEMKIGCESALGRLHMEEKL